MEDKQEQCCPSFENRVGKHYPCCLDGNPYGVSITRALYKAYCPGSEKDILLVFS